LNTLAQRFPVSQIVLTLGEKGAIWARDSERIEQQAYSAQVVDTTAAGDTFSGYFVAGLVEGYPVSKALDLASRAAAICVSRPGAAASIPWREEVL